MVRRAMSKKKASVMEKERQNFVYGNPEEGVPGCISNGIPEKTAHKIFDEMTDCFGVILPRIYWGIKSIGPGR